MKISKFLSISLGLSVTLAGNVFALPVTFNANSSYSTSPESIYVMFIDKLNGSGAVIDKIRLNFQLSGNFNTQNLNSGVFDAVSLQSALTATSATDLDSNTALQVNLSGNLNFNYQNVRRSNDGSAMAQVGSATGQSGVVVNLNGTLDNKAFNINIPIGAMAATKNSTDFLPGYFSPLITPFDGLDGGAADGKITFSMGSWNYANQYSALIAWHEARNATGSFDNQAFTFNLSSDIHGKLDNAPVPEPTTIGLLLSGIIGGVTRRRKNKLS